MKLEYSAQSCEKKKVQISNVIKIRPMGAELFQANRQTAITKLAVTLRNFANAPKNTRIVNGINHTYARVTSCVNDVPGKVRTRSAQRVVLFSGIQHGRSRLTIRAGSEALSAQGKATTTTQAIYV
jgi:hypothetical protein